MNNAPARAAIGGCASSLLGMFAGMFLGLLLGAAAFGNRPVQPPSDDGQRELVRKLEIGGNRIAKFVGGTVGLIGGGLAGAVAGSMIAAYTAAKARREEKPEEGYGKKS